jgi:hypothetical protein
MEMIPINIAVEDKLSEAVIKKIIKTSKQPYIVGACFCRGGFGYLKKNVKGFNNASKASVFLLLTDLDTTECAPTLIRQWLTCPQNPNFLFRIAVKEIESWLLADRINFANFLGIPVQLIPLITDEINDPKRFILNLTTKSKNSSLRNGMIFSQKNTLKPGPNYNACLNTFIENFWDIHEAIHHSPSLKRTVDAINNLEYQ